MKITFVRKDALESLTLAAPVVPVRSPKPILQSVKLTASSDDDALLLATDLEIAIRCRVPGVRVDRPGAVVLPTQRMMSILRAATAAEMSIEQQDGTLVIRGSGSRYELPSEQPELFPDVPDFQETAYYTVGAAAIKRLIRRTAFATDASSVRYALGGALVELTDGLITMVGTDGRRLARATASADATGANAPPPDSPVIPLKAMKLIERNLNDDDPPVHLAIRDANSVLLRTDRVTIYTRTLEGRFPQYQGVFPSEAGVRIPMTVEPLLSAVEQAAVVTSEESRGVDFTFGRGILKQSGQTADYGKSAVEMSIPYDGEPVEVALDSRYLIDALKTLEPSSVVTVELIDGKNAVVFRTEDDFVYVIMPLTKNR